MRRAYSILILSLFVTALAGQSLPEGFNCSTVIVGKDASATGKVLIGHNEDDGGMQVVNFHKIIAGDEPPAPVELKNGAVVAAAEENYDYVWLEMPGQDFADSFLNENGVLVTSNSCPSRERYGEISDGGIGYNLRKLVAERAASARHGVSIAGQLVSELGYNASGRTYTIADSREAWMFSAVRGKHWVAMRIPDEQVVYLPNYYIIRDIDFNDPENYLYSAGLKQYALLRNWYEQGTEFSFRDAYGNERSAESMSNIGRMWTGVNKLSGRDYDVEDQFPESFVPAAPVNIEDIMVVLQNHYEGTPLDDSKKYTLHSPHENKIMNICAGHQQMSFVAELRDDMPVEIGCRMWIAPRRGCVHAYMPVYYGTDDFPSGYKYYQDNDLVYKNHFNVPDEMYDKDNGLAWWSFTGLTDYIDAAYGERIDKRKEHKNKLQEEYFKAAAEFDAEVIKTWEKDRSQALKDISEFTRMILQKAEKDNLQYMEGK